MPALSAVPKSERLPPSRSDRSPGAGGGVPEAVIDGETGFLVPLDGSGSVDVAHFADRVLQLVNSAETRKRFGRAGRQRAEQLFSSEKTNERMAQIFRSAMSRVSRQDS